MQPYNYHSNIPGGGLEQEEFKKYIYSYSFALNPEEYQPSGTYNFSKNDEKLKLLFQAWLTDFSISLFVRKYEYLIINNGKAIKSDVPYQSLANELNGQLKIHK